MIKTGPVVSKFREANNVADFQTVTTSIIVAYVDFLTVRSYLHRWDLKHGTFSPP